MDDDLLLDFIGELEAGPGGYNALQGTPGVSTQGMTISEVQALAEAYKARKDSSGAIGRYQFIPSTLKGVSAGIDPGTPWTPELQDKLAKKLLEQRGLNDYRSGKISAPQFANRLSQEWAALPKDESGQSFYEGQQGNKARTKFANVLNVLEEGPRVRKGGDGVLEIDVSGRRRPQSVDVRMAGGDMGSMVPGDPATGMAYRQGQEQDMAEYDDEYPSSQPKMDMGDFLIALGTGIGSTPTGTGGTSQGVMRGIRAGMQDYRATQQAQLEADRDLYELKQKRAEAKAKQQALQARQQMLGGMNLTPEQRAIAEIDPTGFAESLAGPAGPTYGKGAPLQVKRGDKTFLVFTADDGTTREVEIEGTPIQYDPEQRGAVAQSVATGTQRGKTEESARESMQSLAVIYDEIANTLPNATGSGIGSLRDQAYAFVGASTPGAEAADKLKVLGARLVQTVPRMEGPQSDRDVEMYKQAAGNIADPTIPAARKQAALSTILGIAQRQKALGNPIFGNVGLPTGGPVQAGGAALQVPSGVGAGSGWSAVKE